MGGGHHPRAADGREAGVTSAALNGADVARRQFQSTRAAHWDTVARRTDAGDGWGRAYHRRLVEVYRFLVPPGRRVLEIGCGRGDLLAALRPAVGVGVDFSAESIALARRRHPELRFVQADAHDL